MSMTQSKLGAYRRRAGYSQTEAGKILGRHYTTLSDNERGEYPPTEAQYAAMAKLYGTTILQLKRAWTLDSRGYVKRLVAARRAS